MSSRPAILLLALPFVGLHNIGCQAPAKPAEPTVARVTATSPEEYDLLWEAIGSALRRYYFQPDRQDRVAGIITTAPDTSANWFEFWRPQPQPAYYWAEANLQTIQRDAAVQIRPTDNPGTYHLDVRINRYRHSLEERQIDNPAAALRMYGSGTPTASGQIRKTQESSQWIPLGRDQPMEQAILAAILRRYVPGAGAAIEVEPLVAPTTAPAPD